MRRISIALLIGAALGLCLPGLASAANWARFRGPQGLGKSADTNIPITFSDKQNVLWKLALPGQGNSSPIIWGKYLFVQTASTDGSKRLLLCIDVTDGKQLWARGIAAKPAARGHKHPKNTLASATPVTDGASVFVPFWDGRDVSLVAYDFQGNLLWNRPLGHWVSQHGTGASPILFGDKVIFYNDMDKVNQQTKEPVAKPSTLYAFDKKTGAIVWEVPRTAHRACYSAPFILEHPGLPPELIVTSTTSIVSYDPNTGAENWTWHWKFKGMQLRTVACTVVQDDMLFACAGDGSGERLMNAIDMGGSGKSAHPKRAWQNYKDFPYVPCLLTRGPYVYFANDSGFAGCYEAKTGKRVWFERLAGSAFTASPVLIGDKVYAPSEEGDVYVFTATPKGFEPLAKNSLGEGIRASPAVADGRLYIRGEHHLFCIGKKS